MFASFWTNMKQSVNGGRRCEILMWLLRIPRKIQCILNSGLISKHILTHTHAFNSSQAWRQPTNWGCYIKSKKGLSASKEVSYVLLPMALCDPWALRADLCNKAHHGNSSQMLARALAVWEQTWGISESGERRPKTRCAAVTVGLQWAAAGVGLRGGSPVTPRASIAFV